MVENPFLRPFLLTLAPILVLLPACHFQSAEVTQVGKQAVGFVRSAGGLLASVASLMCHIRFHGLVYNDTTALVMYLTCRPANHVRRSNVATPALAHCDDTISVAQRLKTSRAIARAVSTARAASKFASQACHRILCQLPRRVQL